MKFWGVRAFRHITLASTALANAVVAAPCPDVYQALPLIRDASLCRQFESDTAGVLSYLSPLSIEQSLRFYQQQTQVVLTTRKVKNHYSLQNHQLGYSVTLFPDPNGTKVDILITDVTSSSSESASDTSTQPLKVR